MEIAYTEKALEDIELWKNSGNKQILEKISKLITSIENNPFKGLGKPEALKHKLKGKLRRCINDKHRVVYKVEDDRIFIVTLSGHYF